MCICSRLLSMIKKFVTVLTAQVFTGIFTNICANISSKRQKSIAFYKYLKSWLNWIVCHFLYVTFQLTTKGMFILSSISSFLQFLAVNHTSVYENSKSKVVWSIKNSCEISNNWPNDWLEINAYKDLEFCW